MLGEYGIDFRGFKMEADPRLRGVRQGIWAGLLGGSVGTGMSWWWESLHANNAYPHYKAVADFLARAEMGKGPWERMEIEKNEKVTALGLKNGADALLYVLNSATSYPANPAAAEVPPIRDGELRVANWPAGRVSVEWMDAATGRQVNRSTATATGGSLILALPEFAEDLAGIVRASP